MFPVKTLTSGQKKVTTAGTALALSATSVIVKKLKIKALAGNTGMVYIGKSTVSALTGYELDAGQELNVSDLFESAESEVNLADIYVDSGVNAEGVTFAYID
jgi:hypothetical protein